MNDLLPKISTLPTLRAAYQRVLENRGCAGADGVSLNRFAFNLEANLKDLSTSLQNQSYHPYPLLRVPVPKRSAADPKNKPQTESRFLSVPTVRDRIAQTAVFLVTKEIFEAEFENVSHAYREGRGVKTAVWDIKEWRNKGYRFAVDADIDDYFNPPWKFAGRSRRPPQDPANAVLSFGYVIVGAELQSVLDGVGFDPYLGFYHQLDYGRPSLALDLLEEFRHSLVDRLTLNLFNMNILNNDDFFNPPKGGVYLNISGKRKFFQHYERLIGEYLPSAGIDPKAKAFRAIFQQQVQALAKAVQGEADYQPFQLK
jgi:hypothetical protein